MAKMGHYPDWLVSKYEGRIPDWAEDYQDMDYVVDDDDDYDAARGYIWY